MFKNIKNYFNQLITFIEDDWLLFEERLSIIEIKKGDYLLKEGQTCKMVSFIEKGLVRLSCTIDYKDVTTGFATENEYISDYESFLLQQPGKYNIQAIEDCTFINISYLDLQYLYKQKLVFSDAGRKISENLVIIISHTLTALLTQTPEERYLELVQIKSPLLQRVPQYMLASYLRITPEHLSRIRKKISGN